MDISMREVQQREREFIRAYQEISKVTGYDVKDLISQTLCLIVDRNSAYCGRVGIFCYENQSKIGVKFRKNGEIMEFDHEWRKRERPVDLYLNIPMMLEERKKLCGGIGEQKNLF